MLEATKSLASFVHKSKWEHLPSLVMEESVRAFTNWVGCAVRLQMV